MIVQEHGFENFRPRSLDYFCDHVGGDAEF